VESLTLLLSGHIVPTEVQKCLTLRTSCIWLRRVPSIMASRDTIFGLCRECNSGFDDLTAAQLDRLRTPKWARGSFEVANHRDIRSALEDSRGRFRVWSSNLGAHQPAQSPKSLDSRLRDAPRMRASVVGGLERLRVMITRGMRCE